MLQEMDTQVASSQNNVQTANSERRRKRYAFYGIKKIPGSQKVEERHLGSEAGLASAQTRLKQFVFQNEKFFSSLLTHTNEEDSHISFFTNLYTLDTKKDTHRTASGFTKDEKDRILEFWIEVRPEPNFPELTP